MKRGLEGFKGYVGEREKELNERRSRLKKLIKEAEIKLAPIFRIPSSSIYEAILKVVERIHYVEILGKWRISKTMG